MAQNWTRHVLEKKKNELQNHFKKILFSCLRYNFYKTLKWMEEIYSHGIKLDMFYKKSKMNLKIILRNYYLGVYVIILKTLKWMKKYIHTELN